MPIISQNPATEEILATFSELSPQEIERRLALAEKIFSVWKNESFAQRAQLMRSLAKVLREEKEKCGRLISLEMGRPIRFSASEAEKCAWACEFYADNAESFLQDEKREENAMVKFQPLGPVLAVMPWNFPFWQVFRFAAPAIMAGNVGLLKHASNVPQCALLIEEMFRRAGFPEGVFQTLLIGSSAVEPIIRDSRIRAVTLTGSEKAGSAVAKIAGEEIKKSVLELGGSDPFIVLADADLAAAAKTGAEARLQNNGQSCIAAKRFIVLESVAREFIEKFKTEFLKQTIGDPLDTSVTVGPLATKPILEDLVKQVASSVSMGAEIICGGKSRPGKGYFFEPTILRNVKKGMPVYDQEVFGPVAAVITVKDEDEALAVANDTIYGLGASVWTNDQNQAVKFSEQIEAGLIFVNQMVKSSPDLPFGGIKKSGIGRELSEYGIKEFVNIKTVKYD